MKEDLQIPTALITGSAVRYRPLWSFYWDGIIVSHIVGPWSLLKSCSPKISQDGTE